MKSISDLKFWLKAAFFVVPFIYLINFTYAVSTDQSGGTFGDTFGAANAFFSGTALLMLVFAVILQREELEQVKDERNDTRKLLEGQEDLNQLQKQALEKQIFEQSFNSLLSLAIQEKSRLSEELVIGEKKNSSTLFQAARFGIQLFELIYKGEDPFDGPRYEFMVSYIDRTYFYISLVAHLESLTSGAIPAGVSKKSLNYLIKTLIDDETLVCAVWIVFNSRRNRDVTDEIEALYVNFALGNRFKKFEKAELGLAKALHDLQQAKN